MNFFVIKKESRQIFCRRRRIKATKLFGGFFVAKNTLNSKIAQYSHIIKKVL